MAILIIIGIILLVYIGGAALSLCVAKYVLKGETNKNILASAALVPFFNLFMWIVPVLDEATEKIQKKINKWVFEK